MNVKELVFRGEDETKAYACCQCGALYTTRYHSAENARKLAEICCGTKPQKLCECGKEIKPFMDSCRECARRKMARHAEIVSREDHSGMVFDEMQGGHREGFFDNLESLQEWYEDDETPIPAYCLPCFLVTIQACADDFFDQIIENVPVEDFSVHDLTDCEEIAAAIDAWSAKQTAGWWEYDASKIIILDQTAFDALIAPQPWEGGK